MKCLPIRAAMLTGAGGALAGCNHIQSVLDTHGDAANAIGRLIGIFFVVSLAVWLAVIIALAFALVRRRSGPISDPLAPRHDQFLSRIVTGAVVLSGVVIVALTALSYLTDKGLASIGSSDEVNIRVTGHQWWWEVRYESSEPSRTLTVANEIHIPVGRPIHLTLQSTDVIHSFWIPSLAGKEDLIPGHENDLTFTAERAGVYRGQCAEFCGLQHAHMAVLVIAEPKSEFDAWWSSQLAPASDPSGALATSGRDFFLSGPCVTCHTIRGTPAGGKVAPDLTHFAGRRTIAAGTLLMSHGNLTAWIADPQGIKPGANMPRTDLDPNELHAIVAYLESLR